MPALDHLLGVSLFTSGQADNKQLVGEGVLDVDSLKSKTI